MGSRPNLPLVAACFLGGSAAVFLQPRLLPTALPVAAAGAAFVWAAWRRTSPALLLAAVLAGFGWSHGAAQRHLQGLPLQGKLDIRVQARIVEVVRRDGSTLSFAAEVTLPSAGRRRVALRWYEFPDDRAEPQPGDIWQFDVRLRSPRGLSNPGRRHRADYAFRSGIAASGYLRGKAHRLLQPATGYSLAFQRNRLTRELAAALRPYPGGALVIALAVGDRQHFSDSHWQVLRRTGLSHLVAISGLHIGIVAGLGYFAGALLGGLWRRGLITACCGSAVLAISYAALAGFTIPTRRALLLTLVFLACRLRRREARAAHALAAALLLVLLFDPFAPLDAGFWLSFTAVAVLLYAAGNNASWLRRLWSAQLAVFLGLAPLLLILFGQVALTAPLVNLLLLPLFSLLLVPLVLAGVAAYLVHAGAGVFVLSQAAALIDAVWPSLQWVAQFDALVYRPGRVPAGEIFFATVGSAWLLAPRGWPARWLGALLMLPALLPGKHGIGHGEFELNMLDVGQGQAIVVRTHRHTLLFDTGPRWRSGRTAADSAIIPFLRATVSAKPARMVVSHPDNDHAGGLQALLAHFPGTTVHGSGLDEVAQCRRGQRWFWDGVGFEILHPPAGTVRRGNDASCVVRVSNGRACALLTGDIEAAAEGELVEQQPEALRCALVAAPHHGSKTSSTAAFVTATGARYVLVSVSATNPWGLPHPAVLQRWRDAGAAVYLTAVSGAISAQVSRGGDISVSRYRCRHRRYWRPSCAPAEPGS